MWHDVNTNSSILEILNSRVDFSKLAIYHEINSDLPW